MNAKPPYDRHLPYQSPGAHQNSQWITDEGVGGRLLVMGLIVLSVLGAVGGVIVTGLGFFLGWW